MVLTDDPATNRFRFPQGTFIEPRTFLSRNQNELGFSHNAAGETLYLINAAGTTAPIVLAKHVAPACENAAACEPAGIALLGTSLALDSLFNLMLGGGLILTGVAMRSDPGWRRLAPPDRRLEVRDASVLRPDRG